MFRRQISLFATAAFFLFATTALAHSRPKAMSPEPNSTIASPTEVSVYFTEALEPKFSSLQLTDADGKVLSKDASKPDAADSKHLSLPLPKLAPGTYYVHWVTASADGHRMNGDYKFTVK